PVPPHSFFCASHLRLPDLPSFPTRRSSDLLPGQGVGHHGADVVTVRGIGGPGVTQAHHQPQVSTHRAAERASTLDPLTPRWCPLDRKSTRLNSSHVSISYAVFCLKKKSTR